MPGTARPALGPAAPQRAGCREGPPQERRSLRQFRRQQHRAAFRRAINNATGASGRSCRLNSSEKAEMEDAAKPQRAFSNKFSGRCRPARRPEAKRRREEPRPKSAERMSRPHVGHAPPAVGQRLPSGRGRAAALGSRGSPQPSPA